jgi:hypothetical protein
MEFGCAELSQCCRERAKEGAQRKLDPKKLAVDHRENNTNNLSKTSRLLLLDNNHHRNAPSRKSSTRIDDKKQ